MSEIANENSGWREQERRIIDLFMALRTMLSYLEKACLTDNPDKFLLFNLGNDLYNKTHHIYSQCIKDGIKIAKKEGTQSEWQKINKERLETFNIKMDE